MNFCTNYCLLVQKCCQQMEIKVCRNRYNTISILMAKRLLILEGRVRCVRSQWRVSNTQSRTGEWFNFEQFCLRLPVAILPTRPTQIPSPPTLLIVSLGSYLIDETMMIWRLAGHRVMKFAVHLLVYVLSFLFF